MGVTLVTALVDIGRETWPVLARSFETYLRHLEPLLALDVNLVVLTEPAAADFVRARRRGLEHRTRIRPLGVETLPCSRHLETFTRVMASDEYRADNDLVRLQLPEATLPLYNVLVNSKIHLLADVAAEAPFGDTLHFWIDAGFGHGDPETFRHPWPSDVEWDAARELMLLFQLAPFAEAFYEFPRAKQLPRHLDLGGHVRRLAWPLLFENFYRTRLWKRCFPPAISGGMFGGTAAGIERLRRACASVLEDCLARGIADDEQTTFALCVMKDVRIAARWRTAGWFAPFGDLCRLLGPDRSWLDTNTSPRREIEHV